MYYSESSQENENLIRYFKQRDLKQVIGYLNVERLKEQKGNTKLISRKITAGMSYHALWRGQGLRIKHSGTTRTRSLRKTSKELTFNPLRRAHFGWYLCCWRPERSWKKLGAGAMLKETEKHTGSLLSPPPIFSSPSRAPYLQNLTGNQLAQKNPNAKNTEQYIERSGFGIERQGVNYYHKHNASKRCISHQNSVHNICMHVHLEQVSCTSGMHYILFSNILFSTLFFNARYIPPSK